ncbi:hypothetical protein [Streptomyces sp. KLOTTS4A1]|uniref:hypothetical protein n=1 Tax=Streptomyces sp. KLOTTS4A1 TaxID=3390996 RepID=UPI0039F55898
MTSPDTSRFVRLRVDLVLEVTDEGALTGAALDRIGEDDYMPDEERAHARSAVREEAAEALAYLVDPFDLVAEVPGVELHQASWSSEAVEHDPDEPGSLVWDEDDLDDDEGDDEAEGDEGGDEGDEGGEGGGGEGEENHTRPHGTAPIGA